ncbi:hypothetical protein EQG63_11255 [Flavobacterium amnicola]|uniref:Uncharacterized protein n=1 Tax=Flavobacterium amnicola TaxID=2506422 RepID=A0A4Q1K3N5_9FLAO|nr:hypothetical protein [Flavobacterium amnicola]RXR17358.1 hypothetical protein EQG63_11255 [Flavobacterium amnicola]
MKQLIIICVLLFVSSIFGQEAKYLGKSFILTQNFAAQECDAVGANAKTASYPLERTFVIIVDAISTNGYVVSVPNFKSREELNDIFVTSKEVPAVKDANNNIVTAAIPAKDIYFLIPITEFDKITQLNLDNWSFTVGIPTIPVKLRFGNKGEGDNPRYFRFEGNVSLGLSVGGKYSFGEEKKKAVNFLTGFTVASVQVDSLTTKGKINSNTSAASFSPHLGVVFEIERFQFGLFSGIDFLYGEPNKYWVYRDKAWLGIGFGYSLFKTEGVNKEND